MDWLLMLPLLIWCAWVFAVGLGVGSFLNVLIARLPYEKSIVWPGSRCFTCLQSIRLRDNVPILGYLLLRGRCRSCGAKFSPRYLGIELLTGLAFVGLFLFEIVYNLPRTVGLAEVSVQLRMGTPPVWSLIFFAYHALLVSLLLAAAVIDAQHRIIPPSITYVGTLLGLVGAAFMPWPWPGDAALAAEWQAKPMWFLVEDWGRIPMGLQPWPFWGPTPDWAAPGTWQLGLTNGLVGALAGMFLIRAVKFLFEVGLGREALGLGDADLMMMAGAFLGWQPVVLALFIGAAAALMIKLPMLLIEVIRGKSSESELPFGPGLALGVVITWLGWRWIGPSVQFLFFDTVMLGLVVVIMGGGMLGAGLLLRKPNDEEVSS